MFLGMRLIDRLTLYFSPSFEFCVSHQMFSSIQLNSLNYLNKIRCTVGKIFTFCSRSLFLPENKKEESR